MAINSFQSKVSKEYLQLIADKKRQKNKASKGVEYLHEFNSVNEFSLIYRYYDTLNHSLLAFLTFHFTDKTLLRLKPT